MSDAADLRPEEVRGDAPGALAALGAARPHHAEDGTTETGAETTIIAIGEDLLAATGVDLPMITVVAVVVGEATTIGVVAMTTGLPGEDPATARLTTMIFMTPTVLRVRAAVIRTDHLVEGVDPRRTFAATAEVVVVVEEVAAIATARKRAPGSPCWFETSAPTLPTTTSAWRLDALVKFAMFTSRGITIRSKRKALLSSSTPIPSWLARHATRWIASASRDVSLKLSLRRNAVRVRTR